MFDCADVSTKVWHAKQCGPFRVPVILCRHGLGEGDYSTCRWWGLDPHPLLVS